MRSPIRRELPRMSPTVGLTCARATRRSSACRVMSQLSRPQQRAELGEHLFGLFEDVAPGVAAELVAAGAGLAFAAAVLLPGVAGVVVAVAVELDGQPVVGPAAVDVAAAGRAVGLGQREPRPRAAAAGIASLGC